MEDEPMHRVLGECPEHEGCRRHRGQDARSHLMRGNRTPQHPGGVEAAEDGGGGPQRGCGGVGGGVIGKRGGCGAVFCPFFSFKWLAVAFRPVKVNFSFFSQLRPSGLKIKDFSHSQDCNIQFGQ